MTNLFTNLSKNGSEPVNGSRMDRHYTENGPIHSRQLFAVLAMLWVKLVNFAKLVMQIFKWTKWTEQIFVESAESAKSAKSIFATFATFASANFVGKASCESTVRYREWSRIPSCCLRYSLDSHLSRFSLASLICLCMLTVGVGQMWGATSTITLTQSNLELTGSYSSGATATVGGVTFTHTDLMKNSDNIQVKASTGVLYNSTAMPGKITNITITHTGTARSTKVYYGTTAQPTTNENSFSGSCNIDVSGNNTYFKITRGSNAAYWSSVEITYETAPASACTVTFTKTDGSTEAIKEASAGAGVIPPVMSTPCDGWAFQGWSKSQSTSSTSTTVLTTVTLSGGKYYPSSDVTLYPVYTKSGGSVFARYSKVTSNPSDWSGTYLLAANTSGSTYYTFTGQNGSNDYGNSSSHTPGTTEKTSWEVVVAKTTNGYSIYHTNAKKYLGLTVNDNKLNFNSTFSATTYEWTLSYDNGAQSVNQTKRYIECNTSSSYRVACYAGTQKRFFLYKRIEDPIIYYYSYPSCCTPLGTINGSFFLSPLFEPLSLDYS